MANAKEIKTQIRSIQNTRKVTRALEMVSASKIRKAQDRMAASRPYARMMQQVIGHIAHADVEYRHPYLIEREPQRVGYILISTDRGLCGGLNGNLFKRLIGHMREWEKKEVGLEMVTIGSKGNAFFKRTSVDISAHTSHVGEQPAISDLIGVTKVMLDGYDEGRLDRVYLAYNDFINTMTQQPTVQQLLPVVPSDEKELEHHWDYIYEPDAEGVLDEVLVRYIESLVYQGVMENIASEHAARMVAMKSASDNAEQLMDDLQLVYNKARQAAITQEISEIVSGAAAV